MNAQTGSISFFVGVQNRSENTGACGGDYSGRMHNGDCCGRSAGSTVLPKKLATRWKSKKFLYEYPSRKLFRSGICGFSGEL